MSFNYWTTWLTYAIRWSVRCSYDFFVQSIKLGQEKVKWYYIQNRLALINNALSAEAIKKRAKNEPVGWIPIFGHNFMPEQFFNRYRRKMATLAPKSRYQVFPHPHLLSISAAKLAPFKRKEQSRLLGYRICDFIAFQMEEFQAQPSTLLVVEWSSFHQFSHLMVRPSAPISITASS